MTRVHNQIHGTLKAAAAVVRDPVVGKADATTADPKEDIFFPI